MKLFLVEIFFDIAVQEQFFEKCSDDEFLTLSQNRAQVKKIQNFNWKTAKIRPLLNKVAAIMLEVI